MNLERLTKAELIRKLHVVSNKCSEQRAEIKRLKLLIGGSSKYWTMEEAEAEDLERTKKLHHTGLVQLQEHFNGARR